MLLSIICIIINY